MEAPAAFVCGMGGSAIGGDLAAAALGDRVSKPFLTVRGYELPELGAGGVGRALLELLGRDRGGPGLLRGRRGARRPAAGRNHRRPAGRGRAARRRAGGRTARPASATAHRGRLHVLRRSRTGRAGAGRPAHRHRDRRRRQPPERARRGAGGSGGRARRADRRRRPRHLRLGSDGRGRLPLEDAGEREREGPGLLLGAARGRPQRARGLDQGQAGSRRPGRRPAPRQRPAPS